ncbi:MAG: ECF transporter S component [Atribacterota bacterium]|jgi:hypothetical protein|nr:ECF transporter S component [Atribacterota bacterium]MDD4895254.1 ECF transporter S component [Atribacterota bacterium]MDD5637571.1 ECF transporter S component [Atribacterota bacterium]
MHQTNIKWLTRTSILLAIALLFQMGAFPQFITGPLVNAVLYLASMIVGWQGGILIGILTPIIAAIWGILPPPLIPLIPFIALGNSVLVISFFLLKSSNKFLGIIIASIVKFIILVTAVNLLVQVPAPIAQMMSFPQFVTACTGGLIAILILYFLKNIHL